MSEEQFRRERLYQATIAVARAMLERGLLTGEELKAVQVAMVEKYQPPIGGLLADLS